MKQAPIISKPFRCLLIDRVGSLPQTNSGQHPNICPALKFPEAVPLKELSLLEIVNALLAIFAQVRCPTELECDQGTVFTRIPIITFLEKCGIKVLNSSVYNP